MVEQERRERADSAGSESPDRVGDPAHESHEPAPAELAPDAEAAQEVMSLLSEHVPLTLLADLALPGGPASPEILDEEGLPDVEWWAAEDDEANGAHEEAPSV